MEYVKCNYKDGKVSHILKGKVEDVRVVHYEKGMSTYSIAQENFINATFFSYQKDGVYFSVSPFVENGNKHRWASHDQKSKQSCFVFYKDGSVDMKQIKNISELDMNNVIHVVGGVGLVNLKDSTFKYDPKGEGFGTDILRNCEKSVLGYRDGEIFLVATTMYHSSSTQYDLLDLCREHGFVYAISLDGGGSTVLKYGTEYKMRGDGRKIANGLYFVKGSDTTKPQEPSQDNTIKTQLIQKNYTKGGNKPKYIVIHNTDNATADAQQHYKYWNTNDKANSSAHYVVDDKDIIKLVNCSDTAWHCGKKYGSSSHADCTNSNSIGIEICNHNGCDFDKAMENAIYLVKEIMKNTGISAENVITHKQACAKNCPSTILKLNKWDWFKEMLVSKPVEPPKEDNKFYRVCVGSYGDKANADKMVKELEDKGYKPFIAVYEK